MEQRLKKQRRRLILRITLILMTVWLAVSATYCVIRLHNEKSELLSSTLSELARAKQLLSLSRMSAADPNHVYISDFNMMYFKDLSGENFDSQLMIADPDSKEVLGDTAGKLKLKFSLKTDAGSYPDEEGFVSYYTVRNMLSDSQYAAIINLLQTVRTDGKTNELVCTGYYFRKDEFVPVELTVMAVGSPDDRFSACTAVEKFDLGGNVPTGVKVYYNSDYRINLIPKSFWLAKGYNRDFIASLTDEQQQKSTAVISLGNSDYLFYTSEYFFLDAFVYNRETDSLSDESKFFLLRYAKKENLLKNCGTDLLWGVFVSFSFFGVICLILCLMIWNTVRVQMIQEQKRLDLTNALAHDIKTPLFVISGYAYSLKEDIDSSERDQYLDKIISQTEQINGMVHRMLNLSKLDSYSMTLNRQGFDLYALTEEIASDYVGLPDGKSISLSHSGNSVISADRELIRTALQNLIENAVKYSPSGSKITVDVTDRTVNISNPSEPLSRSELKKIWQPYYRVDKSRHKKGNGLGLSIVRSILDLHGVRFDMSMKDGCMVFHAVF